MKFRNVTAIIRPGCLEEVEESLKKLNVSGLSVSKVKGFGEYTNFYETDGFCTHLRIEVFTSALHADEIAVAIMDAAHSGVEGDGIVAVLPVESIYHIRTREKCEDDTCRGMRHIRSM